MNATIRPEQIDETPEVDNDLAAVSEVEAGIRDFVRNDIAYLRRPAVAAETAPLGTAASAERYAMPGSHFDPDLPVEPPPAGPKDR